MPIETNKAKKSMITDATVTTPYSEGLNIRANIAEIISDIKKAEYFSTADQNTPVSIVCLRVDI
jgi:hypothetical protein